MGLEDMSFVVERKTGGFRFLCRSSRRTNRFWTGIRSGWQGSRKGRSSQESDVKLRRNPINLRVIWDPLAGIYTRDIRRMRSLIDREMT